MVRPVQQELLARQGLQGQPVLLGLLGRRDLLVIREILGQQDLLGQPDRQAVKDLLVPRDQPALHPRSRDRQDRQGQRVQGQILLYQTKGRY